MSCAPIEKRVINKEIKLSIVHKTKDDFDTEKELKKTLDELRLTQERDPINRKINEKINIIESELQTAVQRHMEQGKIYFQDKKIEKAREEFLMVLFLDPEQQEALNYLLRISKSVEKKNQSNIHYILHVTKKGENLSKLAQKYYGDNLKYYIIADFNNINNINNIYVGQKIKIPVLDEIDRLDESK